MKGIESIMRSHFRHNGFTLIELLIVVALIGIITAIAIPSYKDYMLRTGRSDGKRTLLDVASQQERFFSENNQYSVSAEPLANPTSAANIASHEGKYMISVTPVVNASRNTGFTAIATPVGGQMEDLDCYKLTITNTGVRGIITSSSTVGSPNQAQDCWAR